LAALRAPKLRAATAPFSTTIVPLVAGGVAGVTSASIGTPPEGPVREYGVKLVVPVGKTCSVVESTAVPVLTKTTPGAVTRYVIRAISEGDVVVLKSSTSCEVCPTLIDWGRDFRGAVILMLMTLT
jgi:hypothetical protein